MTGAMAASQSLEHRNALGCQAVARTDKPLMLPCKLEKSARAMSDLRVHIEQRGHMTIREEETGW